LVQKWQIPIIENAILLVTRSLQIFTILKNLINLLFFIDGKYSVVDTRHAYEVNEKRKNSIWTWNEGETNSQICTSNGHLHKIKERKSLEIICGHVT